MAIVFAVVGVLFIYAAGLDIAIKEPDLILFHVQDLDVALGVSAAIAAVISLAALAIVHAIDGQRH